MKCPSRIWLGVISVLLLAGCGTMTRFLSVQRARDFSPPLLHRVMVLTLFRNPENRRKVEAEFVKQWEKQGVNAVAGSVALSPSTPLTKSALKGPLMEGGYDALLVLRLLERKSVAAGERSYAEAAQAARPDPKAAELDAALVAPPVYASPHELVVIETSLFDVKTEHRLWSAVTESRVFNDVDKRIGSFVAGILKRLDHPQPTDFNRSPGEAGLAS